MKALNLALSISLLLSFLPLTSDATVQIGEAYSRRLEYPVGVGPVIGSPLGILGIQAEVHFHPLWSTTIGVGSGIYFNAFSLQARRFLTSRPLSPYLSLGYARWTHNGSSRDLASRFYQAKILGLVDENGKKRAHSVDLLPVTAGIHFLSEKGLGIFAEFNYLFSTKTGNGVPFGGLGGQWYF